MLDCHIHIERGPYTLEWIGVFAEQAHKAGLDEIWLLEHSHRFHEFAPLYAKMTAYSDYQYQWYYKKKLLPLADYHRLIERCRQTAFPVRLRFGLEVCYEPGVEQLIRTVTRGCVFDFLTGAVHWVDGFAFDHKAEHWRGRDVDALYIRYYEIMTQLIQSRLFSGVAHPDSLKCFGHEPNTDLSDVYHNIAKLIHMHDMYAENSGGLHLNYGHPQLGLNPALLNTFKLFGVRLLMASDAHKPTDVGANFKDLLIVT